MFNIQRQATKSLTMPVCNQADNVPNKIGKRERPRTAPKLAAAQKFTRNPTIASSTLKTRRSPVCQHNVAVPKIPNVAENAATVEVTVKTHNNTNGDNGNNKNVKAPIHPQKSWSKILHDKDEDKKSSFYHYDPLRTLHFLAKELESRIKKNGLGDPYMEKIVRDMEQALTRVPPEVTTPQMKAHTSVDNIQQWNEIHEAAIYKKNAKFDFQEHEKAKRKSKEDLYDDVVSPFCLTKPVEVSHKCAQTGSNLLAQSDIFQKQLAVATKKLEKSCKDLQAICKQLQSEKDELESDLRLEKDTVKHLRKQISELEAKKIPAKDKIIEQLHEENNSLSVQLKKCQVKLDFEQGLPFHELRDLVQQLQIEKTNIEKENVTLRHQLTINDMEKEKYLAILGVRDRQIEEIRNEMLQLQVVVNEQLVDLQKTPFVSSPSSQSTLIGTFIDVPRYKEKGAQDTNNETGDSISQSHTEVSLQREDIVDKEEQQFRKVPSGDTAEEVQAKIQLLTTSLKNSRTKREFGQQINQI